jgi:hypothetical protein
MPTPRSKVIAFDATLGAPRRAYEHDPGNTGLAPTA